MVVSGVGAVSSAPAGIECPAGACSARFPVGTSLTLAASPGLGQRFLGWEGGPCGTGVSCKFDVTGSAELVAHFTGQHNVAFSTSVQIAAQVLGGLAGADKLCNEQAAQAGLPGHGLAGPPRCDIHPAAPSS